MGTATILKIEILKLVLPCRPTDLIHVQKRI